MIPQTSREPLRYEIEKSPLYELSNKKKLAELLGVDRSIITNPDKSGLTGQYRCFFDRKTRRYITEPKDTLEAIHRRLLRLLVRIAPPDYVHSALKKRSYKTNALAHRSGGTVIKIDIKKFFQSIKFDAIHDFFLSGLRCAPDIATILAKLCVVRTEKHGVHLPTGSCISPVLSFLANRPLFDKIKLVSDSYGCVFTLYVDDITISGTGANAELLNLVSTEMFKRGYRYHKENVSCSEYALITGLVVREGKLYLPHKRVKRIRELLMLMKISVGRKEKILASLVGRLSEAEQIEPKYKAARLRVMSIYNSDWAKIVKGRAQKSRIARMRRTSTNAPHSY
ncbi:reverse transcriptase family protein [Accumulibacter sp.]|uniref:reverse transcriptase family protein n=1 Tax=Accumulibacter sp. TaxID=2053492 RepID=UPI0028C3991E|nr:reverse transcriptase family protein [Accumulibacter sp.]